MEKKICVSCNHENPSGHHFCTQCGSRLDRDKEDPSRLHLLYGQPEGAVFMLTKRKNTIGRDAGNIIVLGDEQISNKHAVIHFEEDSYWIKDLNSKNGVYVNGEKITTQVRLHDRYLIKLGSTILRFESKN